MTLFRKVFQSQPRSAADHERIDEVALRNAFKEMDETGYAAGLGPLEHMDAAAGRSLSEDPMVVEEDRFSAELDLLSVDGASDHLDGQYQSGLQVMATAAATDVDLEVPDVGLPNEQIADMDVDPSQSSEVVEDNAGEVEALGEAGPAVEGHEPEARNSQARATEPVATESAAERIDDETETDGKVEELEDADLAMLQLLAAANSASETAATDEPTVQDNAEPAGALDMDNGEDGAPDVQSSGSIPLQDVAPTDAAPASEGAAVVDLSLAAVSETTKGRSSRRAARAKTRLLGFNRGAATETDPFDQTQETTATAQREKFPVGWLVVVEGPGLGHAFSLFAGASMIGRGEDQVIRLDFGDISISRQNHAAIAYDEEQNKFYLGHGGKSNIIRRNARPVLTTEELHHADLIRIGETTLRFVALCGSDFQWNGAEAHEDAAL